MNIISYFESLVIRFSSGKIDKLPCKKQALNFNYQLSAIIKHKQLFASFKLCMHIVHTLRQT